MSASKCLCGSKLKPRSLRDAAGIHCTYVCDQCEAERRQIFNPYIFKPGTRYAETGEEQYIEVDEHVAAFLAACEAKGIKKV